MDLGDHPRPGGEPNIDARQQRESSREEFPMFNHGRQDFHEQDDGQSMFVEQNDDDDQRPSSERPSYSSNSPEVQGQYEGPSVEEQREINEGTDGNQQAGRGNKDPGDFSSSESSDDEEELEENIEDQVERELAAEVPSDDEEEDEDGQPDKNNGQVQGPGKPGCGTCKILTVRITRLEDCIGRKNRTVDKNNVRMGALIDELRKLRDKLILKDQEINRLEKLLSTFGIDSKGNRSRSAPNPNTARRRRTHVAWLNELRDFYNLPLAGQTESAWESVWRAQYSEGNVPLNLKHLHPDIRLKGSPVRDNESVSCEESGISREASPAPHLPSPRADFKDSFDKLPEKIIINILTELLFFPRQVVHIFSRLDPYEPPRSFQSARRPIGSGIPGRIYLSDGKRAIISLTHDTIKPGSLLQPLLVNKKWLFFGTHIFYGNNTFAFSSFGEFGRFCTGIGRARLQRMAHLELNWQGGSVVRFADEKENGGKKVHNYRSMPLAYLADIRRFDTLVIFIDESSNRVIRRPTEKRLTIQFMQQATAGQPNKRLTRALRVCHGWDYLHLLRGLSWIRIYDSSLMNQTDDRNLSAARDQSAVLDLNRTCRMRKTPTAKAASSLTRLLPLFARKQGWRPQLDDYKLCLRSMGLPLGLRDNDLDKDAPGGRTPSPEPEPPADCTNKEMPNAGTAGGADGDSSEGDDEANDGDSSEEEDNGTDGDSSDGDDDGNDGDSSEGDDDGTNGDSSEGSDEHVSDGDEPQPKDEDIRRDRTFQYVRTQGGGGDFFDFSDAAHPQPKSEGGFVSHLSEPLQRTIVPVITLDDDDEIEIIPRPKAQRIRFTSAASSRSQSNLPDLQRRRSTTSGGLFVTPNPEERSETGSILTASPTPPVIIDLTNEDEQADDQPVTFGRPNTTSPLPNRQSIKRSASVAMTEPSETDKKRMKAEHEPFVGC